MMTRLLINLTALLAMSLIACSSPKHSLKNENFDEAISRALRKIPKSGERAKIRHFETVVYAFHQANQRSLISINALKKSKRPESWITINRLYNKIIDRQNRVLPYADLAASYGYDLDDYLLDYTEDELKSRELAADYLYTTALMALEDGRRGDKLAAREAFHMLDRIEEFFTDYREKAQLLSEAQFLATDHILVLVKNRSRTLLTRRLKQQILDFEVERLNDLFHVYYTQGDSRLEYDYAIEINISDLDITPESERYNTYEESKEISDGWDYVLDDNGNVMKDTSGNDIKVERFKTVTATIEEVRQFKGLALKGHIELREMNGDRILKTAPIRAEAIFENFAGTYYGDREALSENSRRILGNRPLPFPSDEIMLEDAVNLMRPIVLDRIQELKPRV